MLPRPESLRDLSYDALRAAFSWRVPEFYNIGVDVCDRWADVSPDAPAIVDVGSGDTAAARTYTFADMRALSNRMANTLAASGLRRGDRLAILLPQQPETLAAHIGAFKLAAISIPLTVLFGVDALSYRLANSGATGVVTNATGAERLNTIRDALPDLKFVLSVDGDADGAVDLNAALARSSDAFDPVMTRAEDPALIIYTSGTTGQPKGALHAHRVLLGHLPGMEMSHDLFPETGDLMWTPADWAWIGGLINVLFPSLHHGVPVVATRGGKFDPEAAFRLITELGIRNAFIPPTALKMMRAVPRPDPRASTTMRTIGSGGESVGPEVLAWAREALGVTINEFYGQTECNLVVSSCQRIMPPRPGVMGRPAPGHEVAIIDGDGAPLPAGTQGAIAVRAPDPVMFLEYWDNPGATKAKFRGDWLITGDVGVASDDGWLQFVGRDDDVITSSGYRIGPGEIEDCIMSHPGVAMVGVVGKPDPDRTEIIKAFVVPSSDATPDDALRRDIQEHVKTRLAAHEYPREVTFVDALPLTTTGKIIRRELRAQAVAEAEEQTP